MLDRRTFLKTSLITGSIVALNPLNLAAKNEAPNCQKPAPKNRPMEWINGKDLLPPLNEPILTFNTDCKTYRWLQAEKTNYPAPGINLKILLDNHFKIKSSDVKSKNYKDAFHENERPYPPQLLKKLEIYAHPLSYLSPSFKWISLRELITTAHISQDFSLLKPGEEIVIYDKRANDILTFMPCSVKQKPKEEVDGRIYIMTKWQTFEEMYMRVGGKCFARFWIILPKV